MPRFVYYTAVTANGFLATEEDSLEWLFRVPGEQPDNAPLMSATSAIVMGSHTYAWLMAAENLRDQPQQWQDFFGARPTFVFSSRELWTPAGADVRVRQGPVARHLEEIRGVAGPGIVWVMGGGDLVGQFLEAGAIDEIELQVAPVFLAAGKPVLPRTLDHGRVELRRVRQVGQFAVLRYAVVSG